MKRTSRTPLGALAAVLACALVLLAPATARAHDQLAGFMMDDDLLVYNTDAMREYALDAMLRAGVDGVRVTVSWKFVSGEEDGRPRRKPARFAGLRAEDPRRYRHDIWDRFDRIVRLAEQKGMSVLFNVTGPGPVWAHPRAPFRNRFDQPAWKPRVGEFRSFVKAVGRRYSGSYRDENEGRGILPKVRIWSVFNEPNQPASLAPQLEYSRTAGRVIPVAPYLYRQLYYAATSALRATGHARDVILMGETAPLGAVRNTPRIHLWPKQFLREMFCLTPSLRRYTGAQARARKCDQLRRYGPFLATGYAHHPYTQRNPPTRRDPHPDSINLANIGDLPVFLDQLADRSGLIPRGLPISLTEQGWETLPPDPTRGVAPARQAAYLNVAQRIAYDTPRVGIETQFILRDVLPRREFRGQRRRLSQYWATWQSGLVFANGTPKPGLFAYLMPFDAVVGERVAGGRAVRLWGQLRFLPNGQPGRVSFEFRPAGSRDWSAVGGPVTVANRANFYDLRVVAGSPGVWRAVYQDGSRTLVSREVSTAF